MTFPQTTIGTRPVGYAGMIADSALADIVSAVSISVSFAAGVMLVRNGDDGCDLPNAASDVAAGKLLGVAVHDTARGPGGFVDGDPVSVIRKGRVWVEVEENVAVGDQAFVRHATSTTSGLTTKPLGGFRKSADATAVPADTATAAPGCYYVTAASAGGLAILEINLP